MAIFRRSARAAKACLCLLLGGWLALAQAGADHRLRLLPGGELVGQGANHFGQVQPGLPAVVQKPQKLKLPARQWRAVAVGGRHSVAIDATGKVWAWGDNSSGQLGQGHTRPVLKAQPVGHLPRKAIAVAAGMQHSVAQLSDGSIWAWGANNQGQLGTGAVEAFDVTPQAIRVAEPPPEMRSALATGRVVVAKPLGAKGDATLFPQRKRVASPFAPFTGRPTAAAAAKVVPVKAAPAATAANATTATPAVLAPVTAAAPVASVTPVATVTTTPAPAPVLAPVVPAAAELLVTGTVLLSGAPLPDVQVTAAAARCSSTDKLGRYVCKVAPGWSGKISLRRNNYQFSPNALSLQDVRTAVGQQDFAAIYEPR
ncbi:MAG: hypothetical protein PHH58_15670 [Rhodoferax sp.]|nr:hypothetical protein [Rhodoferax sp.]